MQASARRKLLKSLAELYPNPRSELNFKNHYQLLVSVMLSAQCTDKKVNQVTPALFKRYPTAASLSRATVRSLEQIVRPINYYKTKAKHLIAAAKLIESEFGSRIPASMRELRSLPGVGQKTANVLLSEMGVEPALPVDTHVFRVSRRLGIANGNTPEKVEEELKEAFDKSQWRSLHHWLIFHGRRVCKARRPLCSQCKLASLCPSACL